MAPLVERWKDQYEPRGVRFFKIMVGENELIALDFLKHYRSTFPHTIDFDGSITGAYHAGSWPNAVVIDKAGRIVAHEYVWKGGIGVLEDALNKVAKEEPYLLGTSLGKKRGFCEGGICYLPSGEKSAIKGTRQKFPRIAPSPDGLIYVTYTSNETGDNNIFLEKYQNGRLKKRYQITTTLSDEYDSDVEVASDGTVWIAWTSNTDSLYEIYSARLSGEKLSVPMRITRSINDAFHPRLSVDAEGCPWIVYYKWIPNRKISRDRNIFLRRYYDGSWGREIEVSPPEPAVEDHSDPDIVHKEGTAVIAWSYDYHPKLPGNTIDASRPSIFLQKVDHGSYKKSEPFAFLGSTGKEKGITDLSPAIASDNRVVVCAWDAMKTIMVRREENGSWGKVEKLSRGEGPCNAPSVAIARDGTYVCFSQLVGNRWRIVGRVFSGGIWQEPVFLDEGTADSKFPSACADTSGKVWIAYSSGDDKGERVEIRRWVSGK